MTSWINDISNLIGYFGPISGTFSLVKETVGDLIDPLKPSKGRSKTTTSYNLLAAESVYDEKNIDDENIKSTDLPLYVSAHELSVIPEENDKITDGDDKSWDIINVSAYKVNGSVIYYKLQLRG